jgi:hypothetical protein
MNRIEELKATYDAHAAECVALVARVPMNEQLAIQNKTQMNLSSDGQKLREALAKKREAARAAQEAAAKLSDEASAMLAQADQVAAGCQAVLRGESLELPQWPAVAAPVPARKPAPASAK